MMALILSLPGDWNLDVVMRYLKLKVNRLSYNNNHK